MKTLVIAGIGTGVGKTLVSAIVTEALEADYWKPVQAGDLDVSDSLTVKRLISNHRTVVHPEAYRLKTPMSPHAAAAIDGVQIDLNKLALPSTNNHLVVELAGGLMVPLNHHQLNIDVLQTWNAPVLLVSQNYLGSINHTLLSVALLRAKNIPILGIVFNGPTQPSSEEFILQYTQLPCIARIPLLQQPNPEQVKTLAHSFKQLAS